MCTLFAPLSRTAIERSNLSPLDQNRERSRRCSAALRVNLKTPKRRVHYDQISPEYRRSGLSAA